MAKQKRIRWKQLGQMVVDGVAGERVPGDEDLMDAIEARNLAVCGTVEILGDPDSVPETSVIMPEHHSFEDELWDKDKDSES